MTVDLVDLEAFLTLAQELHFGRTAERLRVSSATVTQRIQALERRLGAPLFARTSRRVLHAVCVRHGCRPRGNRQPIVRPRQPMGRKGQRVAFLP